MAEDNQRLRYDNCCHHYLSPGNEANPCLPQGSVCLGPPCYKPCMVLPVTLCLGICFRSFCRLSRERTQFQQILLVKCLISF